MQSDISDSSGPITLRVDSIGGAAASVTDTRGKHWILAELKRLDQEMRFLEEELERLDNMEKASATCKELLSNLEASGDPLLPITVGPMNPLWDRWFEGLQEAQGCNCWIL